MYSTRHAANLRIGTRHAPLRLPRFRTSIHMIPMDPILILQKTARCNIVLSSVLMARARLNCWAHSLCTHPKLAFFDHPTVFHNVINRYEEVTILEMSV
jgi:hypothetical protein